MAPGLRKAPAAVKELKKQHDKTIETNLSRHVNNKTGVRRGWYSLVTKPGQRSPFDLFFFYRTIFTGDEQKKNNMGKFRLGRLYVAARFLPSGVVTWGFAHL